MTMSEPQGVAWFKEEVCAVCSGKGKCEISQTQIEQCIEAEKVHTLDSVADCIILFSNTLIETNGILEKKGKNKDG
jgi:hypothetical protein